MQDNHPDQTSVIQSRCYPDSDCVLLLTVMLTLPGSTDVLRLHQSFYHFAVLSHFLWILEQCATLSVTYYSKKHRSK